MKLHELVSPMQGKITLTEYEWRSRQVRRLELALAQGPDKATKHALERQLARTQVKLQAAK